MKFCIGNTCITLNELKKRLKTYISDVDFKRYFGDNFEIIKYQHLDNYSNIKELLPKNKSFIIILIEWEINIGHWVMVSRYTQNKQKILEYFNSYSGYPSSELNLLSEEKRKELDQFDKHLNNLLRKSMNEFKIIYNKYPLQSIKKIKGVEVGTCGRHCIFRIMMLIKFDLNLQEYIDFMKKISKKSKLNYDEIVAILIE